MVSSVWSTKASLWSAIVVVVVGEMTRVTRGWAGEVGRGGAIRKWSYRTYTRSRLAPQSVSSADLPTLGAVIVWGFPWFSYGLVWTNRPYDRELSRIQPVLSPCKRGLTVLLLPPITRHHQSWRIPSLKAHYSHIHTFHITGHFLQASSVLVKKQPPTADVSTESEQSYNLCYYFGCTLFYPAFTLTQHFQSSCVMAVLKNEHLCFQFSPHS